VPLRILHSIRSVNPVGGGPIEGIQQLSRVNQQRGHTVELVTLDPPDAPWLANFPLPVHALGPGWGKYGYAPRYVPWLRENSHRYDIVIVNGIWQYSSYGTWRALRDSTLPYVVFTHGMLDPWFRRRYPLKHLKKWLYWPWGDYRVLRDAAVVLFTSEQERRLARQSFWLYQADELVVNYGTAGATGDAAAQLRAFRERFPALVGRRQLLFLGRVHPKKGADLLLRAFNDWLAGDGAGRFADWQLVLAGPDDHAYARELKALAEGQGIADRVTWTGMLQGDLKWGAFRSAEAFILPSHQENFGIAVAEALSCCLPVLISREVNIWREIVNDDAGLVESDDLAGTRRLLERWVELPEERRIAMRAQARACFEARFHVERAADSLAEALGIFAMQGPRVAVAGR
jgi:glycosyltransferase involved in cell wall biosynthesis